MSVPPPPPPLPGQHKPADSCSADNTAGVTDADSADSKDEAQLGEGLSASPEPASRRAVVVADPQPAGCVTTAAATDNPAAEGEGHPTVACGTAADDARVSMQPPSAAAAAGDTCTGSAD